MRVGICFSIWRNIRYNICLNICPAIWQDSQAHRGGRTITHIPARSREKGGYRLSVGVLRNCRARISLKCDSTVHP